MATDVGVLVIHGMGDQKADFDLALKSQLAKELGTDTSRVAWEKVHWAEAVSGAQDAMWSRQDLRLLSPPRPGNKWGAKPRQFGRWVYLDDFAGGGLGFGRAR